MSQCRRDDARYLSSLRCVMDEIEPNLFLGTIDARPWVESRDIGVVISLFSAEQHEQLSCSPFSKRVTT